MAARRLQPGPAGCYFITVARLLSLLMMLALALTNSSTVAAVLCQHADARAHAYALQSTDADTVAAALDEEAAVAAAGKKATLADAGTVHLAGFPMPVGPALTPPQRLDRADTPPDDPQRLATRSISPLLQPPLA